MNWELHRNIERHHYHSSWLVDLPVMRFRWRWVGMLYAHWWIRMEPWGEARMVKVEAPKVLEPESGSPYRRLTA